MVNFAEQNEDDFSSPVDFLEGAVHGADPGDSESDNPGSVLDVVFFKFKIQNEMIVFGNASILSTQQE